MAYILTKSIKTVAGSTCNEDAIASGDNYLFVIDGATGLSKTHITNYESDARWFSNELKERLEAAFNQFSNADIYYLLHSIISDLNKEYLALANEKGIGVPPDFPSAGIALFRIVNNTLEFYGLGDCVGVVCKTNGEVIASCDTNLPALDDISIKTMIKASKENDIPLLEARPFAMDVIKENRNKRNTPEGYWILDLSEDGIDHARHEIYDINEISNIFVCSDGFAQLVSPFKQYKDYEQLAQVAHKYSISDMIVDLFGMQDDDRYANKYPRLKFRDDTSAATADIKFD